MVGQEVVDRLNVVGLGAVEYSSVTYSRLSAPSEEFRIGDITINRLGYGAMRLTGRRHLGAPSDRRAALARRLPEIGLNFIDTFDSYGPDVSEELIREALHPYKGLLIATKAGLTRPGPDQWTWQRLACR